MANSQFLNGLAPEPTDHNPVPTRIYRPATSGATVDLFVGSPVILSSGVIIASSSGNTDTIRGAIVTLRDVNNQPVHNLAANDDGYVEVTTDPNQIFRAKISTSALAAGDVGKMYNLTAETGTARTAADPHGGDNFSKRLLDGATEAASARQIVVLGKTGAFDNDYGEAYTEVFCRINSVNYQQ